MKVVIDCNVLVSAARSGGVCGRVIVEAVRRHEVVLSDPLATAVAGDAVLITGNRRDFTEPRYGPVEVFSPRAFLDRLA